MKRLLCVFSVLVLALSLAAAATAPAAGDMGSKVSSACSPCHSLGRVCGKLGGDQAWWQSTVQRMFDIGAQIGSSEVAPMADYLAGLDKAKAGFCK